MHALFFHDLQLVGHDDPEQITVRARRQFGPGRPYPGPVSTATDDEVELWTALSAAVRHPLPKACYTICFSCGGQVTWGRTPTTRSSYTVRQHANRPSNPAMPIPPTGAAPSSRSPRTAWLTSAWCGRHISALPDRRIPATLGRTHRPTRQRVRRPFRRGSDPQQPPSAGRTPQVSVTHAHVPGSGKCRDAHEPANIEPSAWPTC
jgi:hypothetical protein